MGNELERISDWSKSTWNKAKVIGPFLIAQSDKMSEAWQRHQKGLSELRVDEESGMSEIRIREKTKLAEVEVLKEAASAEMLARLEVRKRLVDRLIDSEPEERVRIEQDLEHIDGSTRALSLTIKSMEYDSGNTSKTDEEIKGHWVDAFNDIARRRNEEWRETLLARALSQESESPGSVSSRALWAIGILEKETFEAFSELLSICLWPIGNSNAFLPSKPISAYSRITANGNKVGNVSFLLGDSGFLATGSHMPLVAGSITLFRHGDRMIQVIAKRDIQVEGILLTPLGASIAAFCKREWTSEGELVLEQWKASFYEEEAVIGFMNGLHIPDDV